jgi:hypothetical protein
MAPTLMSSAFACVMPIKSTAAHNTPKNQNFFIVFLLIRIPNYIQVAFDQ